MNDEPCFPFVPTAKTLTDGSVLWFVLHADSLERVAEATDETAVCELVLELNRVCSQWRSVSKDRIVFDD